MGTTHSDRWYRLVLLIGFVSYSIAVLVAKSDPATGYELSIYGGTPNIAWIGFGVPLFISVLIIMLCEDRSIKYISSILLMLALFSFISLPLVRGYYFYASSDTFAQLGWVVDILAGNEISPLIIYPGYHTISTILSFHTGLLPRHIIMLLVPVFVIIFCISVEATSELIGSTRHQFGTGIVIGSVLTPIMTVQLPNLQATPTVLAVLYLAYVLFVFTKSYMNTGDNRNITVFFVSLPTLVLLHPFVAVATLSFIIGVTINNLFGLNNLHTNPRSLRFLSVAVTVLATLTYVQIIDKPAFQGALISIISKVVGGINTTGGVADRAGGLGDIGVSIWEILLKIFGPKTIVGVLAVGAVLQSFYLYFDINRTPASELVTNYSLAMVPIGLLAGIVFAAGRLNLVTRYIGILFVFFSIFAAVGLSILKTNIEMTNIATVFLSFIIFLTLLLSGQALFMSPYLYQESPHVTEAEYDGYAALFDHHAADIEIGSTRSLVNRYRTAHYGQLAARGNAQYPSNGQVLANIPSGRPQSFFFPYHFSRKYPSKVVDQSTYIILPMSDQIIDTELYNGLRYSNRDYNKIDLDRNVGKIYNNGEFKYYLINISE